MASLVHLPLLLLSYLMLFSFGSSVSSTSAEKVKVDLYYETLCPGCSDFMVNDLPNVFKNGMINIIELHLVPYGNAKLEGPNNETITCQHGADECSLNTVEACAIHVWPDVNEHYGFLRCIETLVQMGHHTEWRICFAEADSKSKAVMDCYNGKMGKQLELQYAKETNNLQPPHEFVPWLVVNGEPLKENINDFMTFVCKAYKGARVPEACRHLPRLQVIPSTMKNRNPQVCHADVKTALTSQNQTTSWLMEAPEEACSINSYYYTC